MRKLRGLTLIEMIVVIGIMAIIAATIGKVMSNYDRARRASAFGAQMDKVVTALEEYGIRYRALLVVGGAVPGYANPLQPTVAELRGDANGPLLPPNFSLIPLPGGAYVTNITVLPVGCLPSACDLQYLIYATEPPRNRLNEIDLEFSALAAAEIRANRGGYSDAGFLRGINAGWEVANPTESTVGANDGTVGLLGALGSYRSGLLSQYLRVDGSNQMAANLNVGGNDIVNTRQTQTQNLRFMTTAAAGAACPAANQITGGASGEPLICIGGTWRRIGWRYAAAGDACAGAELAADSTGQGLVCRGSVFAPMADRLPRVVDVAQVLVSDGSVVAQPACGAGGTPSIHLSPSDPGVDFSRVPSPNRLRMLPTVAGANWVVTLGLVDDTGTVHTTSQAGVPYGLQALARTSCIYAT